MLKAYSGHQDFLDRIRATPVEIDQWQLERLALVGLSHKLLFYTPRVPPSELGCLAPHAFTGLDQAIAALFDRLQSGASVALIPDGPYAFASVAQGD